MSWFTQVFGTRKRKATRPGKSARSRTKATIRDNNNINNVPGDPTNLENNNNNYRKRGNAIYKAIYSGGKKSRKRSN